MGIHANVAIDHVTVYCKQLDILNGVFGALGFYSRDGKHYMFRKNYLEGYAPKEGERYGFFPSDAGLHAFIFWSDDPDGSYRRLVEAGYEMAMPVMDFSLPALVDGAEYTASFRGAYLATQLFPLSESALVRQVTPELIYLERPDPHPNTVWAMEEFYLCIPDGEEAVAAAGRLEKTCDLIRGDCPVHPCVNDVTVAGPEELEARFGVKVDPERSCVTGIRFSVEDMAKLRACAAASGLDCHEAGQALVVDASEALNLFLVFEARA